MLSVDESVSLYPHQQEVLDLSKNLNKVAYYYDMGCGKTYIGSEKMKQLNNDLNLLVCQKSKITDWIEHFKKYYPQYTIVDLTTKKTYGNGKQFVGVINYDLIYRRQIKIQDFTLMLDESSVIANENTKRSKAILKLPYKNIILLSGTPVSGKYEKLYSQCKLLGWKITKKEFYERYIITRNYLRPGMPFPIKLVCGYKNVENLKDNLRDYGAFFKKAEEILDLPQQNFNIIKCETTKEYEKFCKDKIIDIDGTTLVGGNTLTQMLYCRQLCSQYNQNKIQAFKDLLNDTDDRLIVFYNFNKELEILRGYCNRPISVVNGEEKDLSAYEDKDDAVTFVQYQAGAKGLNLQKANKIIYFSLPLSCENYMQSQKRIHRIGQERPCFYYILEAGIDTDIYAALSKQEDYTNRLFEEKRWK